MSSIIKELVELCQYSGEGKHPFFVQGGGGNCSVKLDGKMAIKASGYFLEDVNEKDGYVVVDLKTKQILENTHLRPSLEVSIHYLLGSHVIHTHPLLLGPLICSYEGQEEFKKLFPEENFFWIPYAAPGSNLFIKIEEVLKDKSLSGSVVLFLENHGLFVSTQNQQECIKLHESIINKMKDFFNCSGSPLKKDIKVCGFLTPDHIVYSSTDLTKLSGKSKIAFEELESYSAYVLSLIDTKKWNAKYLTSEEISFVKNMEEEKYRQKLLEKNE